MGDDGSLLIQLPNDLEKEQLVDISDDDQINALGVGWGPATDSFIFSLKPKFQNPISSALFFAGLTRFFMSASKLKQRLRR